MPDMPKPPNPIVGPTGQPIMSQQGGEDVSKRLAEQAAVNLARAIQEIEPRIAKFTDTLRRSGRTYEDILRSAEELLPAELQLAKIRKGSVEDLKRLAPEMNMSLEQIRKMPLKDVLKNFDNIASSLVKANPALLGIGTVATMAVRGLQNVYDSLARLQGAAGQFALARGETSGALNPSRNDLLSVAAARGSAAMMGMGEDQLKSMQAALTKAISLPTAAQGGAVLRGAAAVGTLSQTDPATVATRIAEALKAGVSLGEFNKVFDETRGFAKHFGLSVQEMTAMNHDLWRSSRALGTGYEDTRRLVTSFGRELAAGTMTLADIQGLDPARRQFMDTAKMIQLSKAAGVNVPGITDQKDIFSAVGALNLMDQTARTRAMRTMFRGTAGNLAERFGGDTPESGAGIRKFLLDSILGGAPEGLQREIVTGRKAPTFAPNVQDQARLISLAKEATAVDEAAAGVTKTLWKLFKAANAASDALIAIKATETASKAVTVNDVFMAAVKSAMNKPASR